MALAVATTIALVLAAALLGPDAAEAADAFVLPPPLASSLRASPRPLPVRIDRRRTAGGSGRVHVTQRGMFEFSRNVAESETPPVARGSSAGKGGSKSAWKVPRSALESLGRGADTTSNDVSDFLPFEFELAKGSSAKSNRVVRGSFYFPGETEEAEAKGTAQTPDAPPRVVVRLLRESDLPPVVDMCVEEFGSYSNPQNDPFRRPLNTGAADGGDAYVVVNNGDTDLSLGKILEPLWTKYENWAFSWVVRIGLYMRIIRSREGLMGEAPHDHNVVCLVETPAGARNDNSGEVVAIAELSLQPPDPVRNAPPYVLPLSAKRAICKKGGFGEPTAYVSNVLVRPDRRGYGYGRAVMAACEGLARSWGCDDVSLHVDADASSGRAAQGLYRALGYVGVPDEGKGRNGKRPEMRFMGPEMAQKVGLYIVEDVPLLYLRKKLKNR